MPECCRINMPTLPVRHGTQSPTPSACPRGASCCFLKVQMPPILIFFVIVACAIVTPSAAFAQDEILEPLQAWLESPDRPPLDEQRFAAMHLHSGEASDVKQMLLEHRRERLLDERATEWEEKSITLGEHEMKFDFRVFGDPGENGRSLFISMHGGGGAPAHVNEQQWKNQLGLYEPDEGVYLAPRAPTNNWNLWHEPHIDKFFARLIEDAVLFEGVDPNRVYLMGYSAGGDGVYQLAPRMADSWAAAAMMAGHPNDASPLGLRNIGFTLHMGGNDGAYDRNEVAAQWKQKLAQLQAADPEGYQHEVIIHEGKGHWMDREDAVAVPWMANFVRDPLPRRIVWRQSSVTHRQFYWLAVSKDDAVAGAEVVVSRDGQEFAIERAENINRLTLRFNDDMVNLDRPIVVTYEGEQLFNGPLPRSITTMWRTLEERGDASYMFPAELVVLLDD
ncbi:MAG: hypothetical protein ACR2NP_13465, partial [Pirellulaceae bacterium]